MARSGSTGSINLDNPSMQVDTDAVNFLLSIDFACGR